MERIIRVYSPFGEVAEVGQSGEVEFSNIPSATQENYIKIKKYKDYEEAMKELEKEGWSLVPFDQLLEE